MYINKCRELEKFSKSLFSPSSVVEGEKKDGPGPVMINNTLYPAVHISRIKSKQGSGPKRDDVL